MVDLIEDHQRAAPLAAQPVQCGMRRHLRVGQHHTGVVRRGYAGGVAERRVEGDTHRRGSLRPLPLQVLGRSHHGDRAYHTVAQEIGGDSQGKRRLAGTRRRDSQKVAGAGTRPGLVGRESGPLPRPQRMAPR